MKNLFFFLIIVLLSSCDLNAIHGSNDMISKKINLKDFTSIDASNAINIHLVQSEEYKVTVECNKNIEKHLALNVKNNCLYIRLTSGQAYSNIDVNVTIYAPSINEISASGACDIMIEDYKTENFSFDLSGATDVEGKLIIKEKLKIEASGASELKLRGKTKELEIDFSGASKLSAKKLIVAENTIIESSGASSVTVTANGKLSIDCSGASDVIYHGDATIIAKEVSGASRIEKK